MPDPLGGATSVEDDFPFDSAVLSGLIRSGAPDDTRITKAVSYGTSIWTRTGRITAISPTGEETDYFLKLSTDDAGKLLISGEYESMRAIHQVSPQFCPEPICWGTYDRSPSTHFFLMGFIEMSVSPPPATRFCEALADLHTRGTSPNGKFGFHTSTCVGNVPQINEWYDKWEDFFAARWRRMLDFDTKIQGRTDEELARLAVPFFEKVIPALLRPLESEGRSVKPSLIHGDLWCGNASSAAVTGLPIIYDASAVYAHNEFELGNWRPVRNKFGRRYFDAYTRAKGRSEPVEQFDDRNALYSTLYNLYAVNLFPDQIKFRHLVIDEMKRLVERFGSGHN